MSKKQTGNHSEDSFENVENALSSSEQFIEDNSKLLSIIALAIIIVIGGYWASLKFYFEPQEKTAETSVFYAQQYFEKDSFNLALNGDGLNLGFLDIIDNYGSTKIGNLSKYYAGIAYLHLGQFDTAIDYLKGFSSDDELINAMAMGATGDAYSELDNKEEALSCYQNAAALENEFSAPIYLMKAGLILESLEQFNEAVTAYTTIKEKYSTSTEARAIEKYITRASIKATK